MIIQTESNYTPITGATLLLPVASQNGKLPADTLRQLSQITGQSSDFIGQCFEGGKKEIFPLVTADQIAVLIGLGDEPSFRHTLRIFQQVAAKHKKLLGSVLQLHFGVQSGLENVAYLAEAAVNGLLQGAYQLGKYKSDDGFAHPLLHSETKLTIIASTAPEDALQAGHQRASIIAQAQRGIMDLVDRPANHKTPQHLAQWATDSANAHGYKATVWTKEQIVAAGLGGLLAVNQGSPDPPVFIVMEYQGKTTNGRLPKVGLVGKGVTFDTGGLSLKPSANMHYMKSDMGGAAAVLGTMEAAARLALPIHLIGIVPSTDNSVDAQAVKPSDVITTYSGKTIEIIDTDAEGRLILADGLAYMVKHFQPDVLIDLATLTGSSVRALGYIVNNEDGRVSIDIALSGVFGNEDTD
ncbi:MAG: leucyl aminopeptidase family protein, partial [Bacteroidota bacterium]